MSSLDDRLKAVLTVTPERTREMFEDGDSEVMCPLSYALGQEEERARTKEIEDSLIEVIRTVTTVVRSMSETGIQSVEAGEPERDMYDAMVKDLARIEAAIEGIEGAW